MRRRPRDVAAGALLAARVRRGHGGIYKALDRGRLDSVRARGLLVAARPDVFAVDASAWCSSPRPAASTAGRGCRT